jgi:ribokinase
MTTPTADSIIVIGSINTDMVVKTEVLPRPGQTVLGNDFLMNAGGKGANQAVAAARLGGKVAMVGNLGVDNFGDLAIKRLQSEGVNCSFITRDESNASGVALISVDALGENHIVVAPGANHSLSKLQINQALSAVTKDTLVLLQLEIPLSCVSYAIELANSAKCRVILDPAPAQDLPRGLFEGLFLITPNETEAETLTGITINNVDDAKRAANKLLSFGVRNVAITLGKQGVLLSNADQCEIIKAPSVHAIDTTAAGDCFNGALACALARDKPLRGAVAFACKAAAISVTHRGAQSSMPTKLESK